MWDFEEVQDTSRLQNILRHGLFRIGLLFRNQRKVRQSFGVSLNSGKYWRKKSFKYLAPVEVNMDHCGRRCDRACCCMYALGLVTVMVDDRFP